MPRIIDMECSVPYGAAAKAKSAEAAEARPAEPAAAGAPAQPGYGMANYGRIFRSRREGADQFAIAGCHLPGVQVDPAVGAPGQPMLPQLEGGRGAGEVAVGAVQPGPVYEAAIESQLRGVIERNAGDSQQ